MSGKFRFFLMWSAASNARVWISPYLGDNPLSPCNQHTLKREVAERLANEAVKAERQEQIVELGGLKLLLPLTKSVDPEVQRLAAHALANLSVNAQNQVGRRETGTKRERVHTQAGAGPGG